jgi:hypothetical protein
MDETGNEKRPETVFCVFVLAQFRVYNYVAPF